MYRSHSWDEVVNFDCSLQASGVRLVVHETLVSKLHQAVSHHHIWQVKEKRGSGQGCRENWAWISGMWIKATPGQPGRLGGLHNGRRPFDTVPVFLCYGINNWEISKHVVHSEPHKTVATNNRFSVHQTKRCHRLRLCFAGPGNCTGWVNCPKRLRRLCKIILPRILTGWSGVLNKAPLQVLCLVGPSDARIWGEDKVTNDHSQPRAKIVQESRTKFNDQSLLEWSLMHQDWCDKAGAIVRLSDASR